MAMGAISTPAECACIKKIANFLYVTISVHTFLVIINLIGTVCLLYIIKNADYRTLPLEQVVQNFQIIELFVCHIEDFLSVFCMNIFFNLLDVQK